jgi:hypothetical protein
LSEDPNTTSEPQDGLGISGESLSPTRVESPMVALIEEDKRHSIPEMEIKSHTEVVIKIVGDDTDKVIPLSQEGSLKQCVLNQSHNKEIHEDNLDNLSDGEHETQDLSLEWDPVINIKKRPKKKW